MGSCHACSSCFAPGKRRQSNFSGLLASSCIENVYYALISTFYDPGLTIPNIEQHILENLCIKSKSIFINTEKYMLTELW